VLIINRLKIVISILFVCFVAVSFAQFETVKIGNQTWSSENLNVDAFRNGDKIKQAKSARKWKKMARKHKPAWCYYENKTANGVVYGKLYNWYAVNDPRGLVPCGWHVPTDKEWNELSEFLGGEDVAGIKLKSDKGWKLHINNLSDGNNKSGFKGLPGGYRFSNGDFFYKGNFGYWWSATLENDEKAFFRDLSFDKSSLGKDSNEKVNGMSVRCVKD
jgi:uncharacterized protein (TIGR02145 family)